MIDQHRLTGVGLGKGIDPGAGAVFARCGRGAAGGLGQGQTGAGENRALVGQKGGGIGGADRVGGGGRQSGGFRSGQRRAAGGQSAAEVERIEQVRGNTPHLGLAVDLGLSARHQHGELALSEELFRGGGEIHLNILQDTEENGRGVR